MEDGAFAFFAVLLLQERDLVADAELYVFCDMQVSLGACLKIDVVPHHKIEGTFKALARAIRMAVARDVRHLVLPSSKGTL